VNELDTRDRVVEAMLPELSLPGPGWAAAPLRCGGVGRCCRVLPCPVGCGAPGAPPRRPSKRLGKPPRGSTWPRAS